MNAAAVDFAVEQDLCLHSSFYRKDRRNWFHAIVLGNIVNKIVSCTDREMLYSLATVQARNDMERGSDHKPIIMCIRLDKPHRPRRAKPHRKFDIQVLWCGATCGVWTATQWNSSTDECRRRCLAWSIRIPEAEAADQAFADSAWPRRNKQQPF